MSTNMPYSAIPVGNDALQQVWHDRHRLLGGRSFGRGARTGRAEPPAGVFAEGGDVKGIELRLSPRA
jgi:hypothetical protein